MVLAVLAVATVGIVAGLQASQIEEDAFRARIFIAVQRGCSSGIGTAPICLMALKIVHFCRCAAARRNDGGWGVI